MPQIMNYCPLYCSVVVLHYGQAQDSKLSKCKKKRFMHWRIKQVFTIVDSITGEEDHSSKLDYN